VEVGSRKSEIVSCSLSIWNLKPLPFSSYALQINGLENKYRGKCIKKRRTNWTEEGSHWRENGNLGTLFSLQENKLENEKLSIPKCTEKGESDSAQ